MTAEAVGVRQSPDVRLEWIRKAKRIGAVTDDEFKLLLRLFDDICDDGVVRTTQVEVCRTTGLSFQHLSHALRSMDSRQVIDLTVVRARGTEVSVRPPEDWAPNASDHATSFRWPGNWSMPPWELVVYDAHRHRVITSSEYALMLPLAEKANPRGKVRQSIHQMMLISRLSENGVRTVLQQLCESGLIRTNSSRRGTTVRFLDRSRWVRSTGNRAVEDHGSHVKRWKHELDRLTCLTDDQRHVAEWLQGHADDEGTVREGTTKIVQRVNLDWPLISACLMRLRRMGMVICWRNEDRSMSVRLRAPEEWIVGGEEQGGGAIGG